MADNVGVGGRGSSRRSIKGLKTSGPLGSSKSKPGSNSASQYISVGRGTSKIKFGDITPSTNKNPTGKGMWVRTGRGTGKRKVE